MEGEQTRVLGGKIERILSDLIEWDYIGEGDERPARTWLRDTELSSAEIAKAIWDALALARDLADSPSARVGTPSPESQDARDETDPLLRSRLENWASRASLGMAPATPEQWEELRDMLLNAARALAPASVDESARVEPDDVERLRELRDEWANGPARYRSDAAMLARIVRILAPASPIESQGEHEEARVDAEIAESLQQESDDNFADAERYREALELIADLRGERMTKLVEQGSLTWAGAASMAANTARTALDSTRAAHPSETTTGDER